MKPNSISPAFLLDRPRAGGLGTAPQSCQQHRHLRRLRRVGRMRRQRELRALAGRRFLHAHLPEEQRTARRVRWWPRDEDVRGHHGRVSTDQPNGACSSEQTTNPDGGTAKPTGDRPLRTRGPSSSRRRRRTRAAELLPGLTPVRTSPVRPASVFTPATLRREQPLRGVTTATWPTTASASCRRPVATRQST